MISFLKSKKTRKIAFASVALLTILTVGATLAYYVQETDAVTNIFKAGMVETEIEEDVHGLTKEITVKNTGASPCLVRIRFTATPEKYLKLRDGSPEILDNKWTAGADGFYYYNGVLDADADTDTAAGNSFILHYELTEEFNKLSEAEKQTALQEMNVNIYQEAIQTSVGDLSAVDENGNYIHEKALALWALYDAQK